MKILEEAAQDGSRSFNIKKTNLRETEISEDHVGTLIQRRTEILAQFPQVDESTMPDRLFVAQQMKAIFKRTKEKGVCDSLMLIISTPLNFIRDISTPMGEEDAWNRTRASILPMTLVISFFYLNGDLDNIGTVNPDDDDDT